jgi:hypothetical protein
MATERPAAMPAALCPDCAGKGMRPQLCWFSSIAAADPARTAFNRRSGARIPAPAGYRQHRRMVMRGRQTQRGAAIARKRAGPSRDGPSGVVGFKTGIAVLAISTSCPCSTASSRVQATMVIGREVVARRAVGLHVVSRAICVEGHGPFPLGQAREPDDDHLVSNVDHRTRGPRR